MLLAAFYEQEEWIRPIVKKFAFEEGIRLACYQTLESAESAVKAVDIRRRNLIDALTTITAASALQASSQEPTVPAREAPLENSSPLPPDFMQEIDMGPLLPPDQSANNLMQSSEESNQHVENAMEGRPSQQAQQSPQTHPQASEPEPRRAQPNEQQQQEQPEPRRAPPNEQQQHQSEPRRAPPNEQQQQQQQQPGPRRAQPNEQQQEQQQPGPRRAPPNEQQQQQEQPGPREAPPNEQQQQEQRESLRALPNEQQQQSEPLRAPSNCLLYTSPSPRDA